VSRATAHTPAPWAWSGHSLGPANPDPTTSAVHTVLTVEDAGFGFAGSDREATHAELLADHRLMAAAPAMFEALAGARAALVQALGIIDAALGAAATQGGVL